MLTTKDLTLAQRRRTRTIRTTLAKYATTLKRAAALLGNIAKADVGLALREGYTLPEHNPEKLRMAYSNLLGLELVAAEGRARLVKLVEETYGPEALAYVNGTTHYKLAPDLRVREEAK